jgi:4-aminobutyrate aminotransferase-like enzyme
VRRVDGPDSYRLDPATLGERMAAQVAHEVRELERRGEGLAAFIADSLFSSDGIYADPVTLLAPVAEVVRKAGGLFIADEVQSGFGRSGTHLWGYQRHGIDPDIVTMGKPMGNGFPVAGIAVAPEVIQRFGQDMRYFNTFGGNTVAVAAAQATFDVIREEGLMANADAVGRHLRDGLAALAKQHEVIGDVRGTGLYIGVEMVRDRGTKEPNREAALAAVNGLRERRVLISATGYHANTLKIRPPLVFAKSHADRLLTELDAVLRTVRV